MLLISQLIFHFSFNNEDIHVIKQCFQYTSTVLTSTLAFQNERKLKIQTQVFILQFIFGAYGIPFVLMKTQRLDAVR